MRKITLLLIAISFIFNIHAQKIQVKGDILYVDKAEFGTMKGEVSLAKPANYTIAAKDGTVIYTINEGSKMFHHPLVSDIYFYTITFGDSKKSLSVLTQARCVGPKCLIKKFIKENEILLAADGIKNQDEIIRKYDQSGKIAEDTLKAANTIKDYKVNAEAATTPERDKKKPVKFIKDSQETFAYTTKTTYTIVQDSLLIGSILIESTPANGTSSAVAKYWIYARSTKIHVINHKPERDILIAYSEASTLSLEPYIFATGKEEKVKAEDNFNAKSELVNYLITKGYM